MKLLIVDDHMIIRRGLIQILAGHAGVGAILEAADAPGALQVLRRNDIDVVFLDIELGERDGLDLLRTIRNERPNIGVIMLSVYPEGQFGVRAIKSGASAYLNKGCSPDELYAALDRVACGGVYITPQVAELLARNVRREDAALPHEALSNREFQVLKLLANGRSISEIAQQLSLSVNTVSTYRARVCEKLNLKSAFDIFTYAAQHHLISVATQTRNCSNATTADTTIQR